MQSNKYEDIKDYNQMGRARHLFTQITRITAISGAKTDSINNAETNVLLDKDDTKRIMQLFG